MDKMNELIAALREDTAYDFISRNAWSMKPHDLGRVIMELLYVIYENSDDPQADYNQVADELAEIYLDEGEE